MAGRPLGLRSLVKALGKLSPAQLKQALSIVPRQGELDRLERDRQDHLAEIKTLDRRIAKLSGGNGHAATPARKRRRRKISAETRRKMSEAAKHRYAKAKGSAPKASGKPARRKMSAETRAKMAEAARRRWAKAKVPPQPT